MKEAASLKNRNNPLSKAATQRELLEETNTKLPLFEANLNNLGFDSFCSSTVEILQINMGKMCNQVCEHCHVDAGPDRTEIMTRATMFQCLEALKDPQIKTVDLTGGAPEMNPDFKWFVQELFKLNKEIIVRSNLTFITSNEKNKSLPQFFKDHKLVVISSLPCYTKDNTDAQRGEGVFDKSMEALKLLNDIGYGVAGSDLQLHLVYNPLGALLPPPQEKLKVDYQLALKRDFGISFNDLYTITNMPISRYLNYLLVSKKYEDYMQKLIEAFNPSTLSQLMCRNTISVGWQGELYDCDFNQMLEMPVTVADSLHISEYNSVNLKGRTIAIGQHCYGCTAGAGSSCQGAIA